MSKVPTDTEELLQNSSGTLPSRGVPIAPVLRPGGRKSTLSDGCVLLSGGVTIDLQASERFRILRTRIERRGLNGKRQQIIAMSSAVPEEGKSVVSVNLARAFGMDPQGKTLIIDCDLRKPNVHRFFDEMQSPGLSDVLVAGKPLKNVIRSVEPGLDLLCAGSPVVDATRTIEQPGLALLLDELRKHYRHIILDCPPVLLCSEPLTLSGLSDCGLMVVRSWRTQKKLVREAVNMLGSDKLLGVVLNECTDTLQQYGYYSYYGYDKEAIVRARLRKQQDRRGGEKNAKPGIFSRLFRRGKKAKSQETFSAEAQRAWKQPEDGK
jgi:capsular exopolysaccharide synthesis family protein